jgi:hypothetical protein
VVFQEMTANQFQLPIVEFDTYHECIYFGYDYSSILLKEMTPEVVDKYEMYTRFDCKVDKII